MKCYNCGQIGHSAQNCSKNIICHKCKKSGHISKNCPLNKNNNINNNNINLNINNNNNNNETGEIKCYNCGKTGHKVRECPNKRGKFCYICGKSGHFKSQCPDKNKKNKEKKEEKEEDKINIEDNNNLNCPICFDNSSSGKKFLVSVCGHIICKDCRDSIFKSSNSSQCPICKTQVKKDNYRELFI